MIVEMVITIIISLANCDMRPYEYSAPRINDF